MNKEIVASIVAVAVILFASSSGSNLGMQKASAAVDAFDVFVHPQYFVKLDGVTGEGPQDLLPTVQYNWGGSQAANCNSEPSAANGCEINWGDMTLHLATTLGTPQLFLDAAQGKPISGTLYIVSGKGDPLKNPLETISWSDGTITSFTISSMSHNPAEGPVPCTVMTIHFKTITFTSYGANGQVFTATWDFTKGTAQ